MPNHRTKLSWTQNSPVGSHAVPLWASWWPWGEGGTGGRVTGLAVNVFLVLGCVRPSRTWPAVLFGLSFLLESPWLNSPSALNRVHGL